MATNLDSQATKTAEETPARPWFLRRRWVPDALGLGWVVLAAAFTMLPALIHGVYLGSYDILSTLGLSQNPAVALRSNLPYDQITEFIPWSSVAWTQVHHGQLPLWNPYSALGTPLAFNWQSATFNLPTVLGYLVPLRFAYTVQILSTLVLGGTGVYVLGRVMRLGILGCTLAATAFELSGSFMGWLGWPIASVMAWAGWLFAAILLVARPTRHVRYIAFLAVIVAFVFYAGQIDTLLLLTIAVVTFLVVLFGARALQTDKAQPLLRPAVDLVVAAIAGFALAAPLALPALQLATKSIRTVNVQNTQLAAHDAFNLVFQGFNGLPWAGSSYFDWANYLETAGYVGVIVLVLALTAMVTRRRRPDVTAFTVTALVMTSFVFIPSVVSIMDKFPYGHSVQWHRALLPLDFILAVLAGVGADVLAHRGGRRRSLWYAGAGFVGAAALLLVLWFTARGTLPPIDAKIRKESFIWPAVTTIVGLVAFGMIARRRTGTHRKQRPRSGTTRFGPRWWGVALLLLGESAFLVSAGSGVWSSSSTPLTATPPELAYEHAVGTSLVGFGTPGCTGLGILQESNALFGVSEFAAYDPLLPRLYYSSWKAATGTSAGPPVDTFLPRSEFCPAVTSVAEARLYGIRFVLEPEGTPGPKGAIADVTIKGQELFRIPGAAPATLSPLGPGGARPNDGVVGTPVPVTHPNPASWKLVTNAQTTQELRLRLTNVPGWHATIDGKPLKLIPFSGIMLQARVPAGRHVIELKYWPSMFKLGIILAVLSAFGLVGAAAFERVRRRTAIRTSAAT